VDDLVPSDDPDLAKWKAGDEEWYLHVAGEAVRQYCGWHIAPSITETVEKIEIGSQGIIMLPSLYVTDVASVVVTTGDQNTTLTHETDYEWFQQGYVQRVGWHYWGDWGSAYGGYYYGNDPYYLPVYRGDICDVTFTHGYDECPDPVKQVIFELAGSAALMPVGGGVSRVHAPGYSLVFDGKSGAGGPGLSLTGDQECRLSDYKIGGVI